MQLIYQSFKTVNSKQYTMHVAAYSVYIVTYTCTFLIVVSCRYFFFFMSQSCNRSLYVSCLTDNKQSAYFYTRKRTKQTRCLNLTHFPIHCCFFVISYLFYIQRPRLYTISFIYYCEWCDAIRR